MAVDGRGTVLSINRSENGLPLAQQVGGSLFDRIAAEDHQTLRASLAQVFTAGRPARFEGRVLGPSGSTTWYEFRVAALARRGRVNSAALVATDISGRKRAELALASAYQEADERARERTRALSRTNERLEQENEERRQAEQELRTILDTEPECVKLLAADGTLQKMNAAGLAMIQADGPEEVVGRSVYTLVAPEYRDALRQLYEGVFRGRSGQLEFEAVGLKGRRLWLETHAVPLRDAAGRIASALGITLDITERKRAEAARLSIEERYRALVENMPALAYLAEANELGSTLYIGPQVSNVTGFSAEEWTRDPALWAKRLHPEDRERVLAEWADSVNTGTPFRTKYRVLTKDGRLIWWRDEAQLVHDDSGRALFHGIVRDVTAEEAEAEKRREAEQALRHSEARYRSLFERNLTGVYRSSLDGRILECNAAFAHTYGYASTAEVLGLNASALYAVAEDRAEFVARLQRERALVSYEATGRRRDGSAFPLIESVSLVAGEDAGSPLLEGVVLDLTERTRAEAHLARNLDRSQRLFEITAAVNRGAESRDVLELVLDALVQGIGADRASILLCDAAGVMRFAASRGLSEAYRQTVEGHSPWAPDARNPEPIVVADVASATELGPLRETILGEGIRALAFVPIFTDRLLGKFMLYYDAPHPPDEEEIQFALTVARHIGLATQRDRDDRARQASHDQIRRLAGHLQQAREEERARIAREVHDELGQTLTALKLDLAWLKGRLARRPELAVRVAETSGLADAAIRTVRRIATTLRPGVLDDLGLAPAVEWLAQDAEARTGIRCRLDASFEDVVADREAATHIFRLFQEALTNVIRHSGASDAWLKLAHEGGDLLGEICDNGRGLSKQQASDPKALGLIGMRERVRLLGGEIEFAEGPTGGTLVRFRCPLRVVKPQESRAT